MKDPKIYIALDNCFAIKRWVEPKTWLALAAEMGYTSVEASYDNEIDPLYNTEEYREEWLTQLAEAEKKYGVKVESFYTGYQTYCTAGLAHPNEKIVRQLIDNWVKPAITTAGKRGNDMGFSLHCIPENIMEDPEQYKALHEKLYRIYSDIGAFAEENGNINVCIEAMYVPQQTPWTIEGTKEFLKNIYAVAGHAMYTTVDVGHMTGQRKFKKPTEEQIQKELRKAMETGTENTSLWLGSEHAYEIFADGVRKAMSENETVSLIMKEMERNSYQFSTDERDSDLYAWIEELGCYSPIMHIQQTNGITASHAPFTRENNEKGIVDGKKILENIAASYEKEEPGMPPDCMRISSIIWSARTKSILPREKANTFSLINPSERFLIRPWCRCLEKWERASRRPTLLTATSLSVRRPPMWKTKRNSIRQRRFLTS